MSGLLATLLDAAQGRAAVVTHRPHARFEPASIVSDDIVWRDPDEAPTTADRVAGAAPAPHAADPVAPTLLVDRSRGHASSVEPLLPSEARRSPAPATAQDEGVVAPSDPIHLPPPPGVAARRLPADAAQHIVGAATPAVAGPVPLASALALPQEGAEAADARFRPLLPPQAPVPNAPGDPVPTAATPADPAETAPMALHESTGFTLRIGRIEVRAAPPAPATPPAEPHAVVTRPVALPRATVRQSLDDYRAGRKR